MLPAALRTGRLLAATDEQFEVILALLTGVFINGHGMNSAFDVASHCRLDLEVLQRFGRGRNGMGDVFFCMFVREEQRFVLAAGPIHTTIH